MIKLTLGNLHYFIENFGTWIEKKNYNRLINIIIHSDHWWGYYKVSKVFHDVVWCICIYNCVYVYVYMVQMVQRNLSALQNSKHVLKMR